MTQRPQHLLTRASAERRVFFWEEPIWHAAGELAMHADGSLGMYTEVLQESPSLWVIQPHLSWGIDFEEGQRALLNEFLAKFAIEQYVCWYYTAMAYGFSAHLRPTATVYDCMDELSAFLGAPRELVDREQKLLAAADVVFTGGISLYEAKKNRHSNVHAFPSSIDVAHFAQARDSAMIAEPADQGSIAHPRAGFYGVIDERFDLALLRDLAALRPTIQFVLIGPVVKIDEATLPRAANIHYLGSKSYAELPSYLAGWDVAILPFARNEATRFISPTKTPEYLAAGKTVVSTSIRDVVRGYRENGLVAIADDPQAFAEALDRAFQPQSATWQNAVAKKLAESSWDSTWAEMRNEIARISRTRSLHLEKPLPENSKPLHIETIAIVPSRALHASRGEDEVEYIVAGAGFAGSVVAERLASQMGKRVLVVDKRDHIAGNAYDHLDEHGILVHKYGPHIFHTNSEKVVAYLSQFTKWRPYEHRVLSSVDGKMLPVPINLDTVNRLYDLNLDADGLQRFLAARVVVPPTIRTSEEVVISRVGRELYEKFFQNYTRKQWGLDPSELDASVAGRIPVRYDRDDRYFTDTFQAMPRDGYTRMFEKMLDHPGITVETGTSYQEARAEYPDAKVIYTGPIDEYFDFCFGMLPYRSLEFRHETHDREVYQAAPVVNYPNDHAYTRVTEFKYLTGQQHGKTSIVYEYPRAEGDPYYPIPRPENAALYAKYQKLAMRDSSVYFCGRLANYKYFNMDQVVAQALATFRNIEESASANLAVS